MVMWDKVVDQLDRKFSFNPKLQSTVSLNDNHYGTTQYNEGNKFLLS